MKRFKTYKSLPKEVKTIVDKYPYANDDITEQEAFIKELEAIGYKVETTFGELECIIKKD
jgi:hypothetical protein